MVTVSLYSHPWASAQEPPWIPKSADAQVPYIKWGSTVGPLYPWVPHPQMRADCMQEQTKQGT